MKVLVTGASGQLGFDVIKLLEKRGIACIGPDRSRLDIRDEKQVSRFMGDYRPDVVIHCAAYTAVDQAEEEAALCRQVNVDGTRFLAENSKRIGAKMLYVSTDYVFPGNGTKPYATGDATGPLNVYGGSKLDGEKAVQAIMDRFFIARVSWVFGQHGHNFVKTMVRLGQEKEQVNVVGDQIGSPSYTADLALLLCNMVETDAYGIYHATNEGECSWAAFAEEIFRLTGSKTVVCPIETKDYPTKATRPLNSRLDKSSIEGFGRLPHWKDALARYLKES